MKLNSQEAQRLVDLVAQAQDVGTAVAAAEKAFSFLVGQLHILGDSANGYPRNPIDGNVWQEGRRLTSVCDQFADAVSRWHQRRGEEQATRLAVTMAMQVVGHYPEEIFPRVLRNAKCCESLGMTAKASAGYRCILGDFDALHLEGLFDRTDPLEGSRGTILSSLREALAGLQRLSEQGLTAAELTLLEKVNTALNGPNRGGTEFERASPPAQPPPHLIPSEAPWTKFLPIVNSGSPPYWTCNIALPKGVTNEAVVDFVFACVRNKLPSEECMHGLRRELGIDPKDCELVMDRVRGGVFRASTGIPDNCPDRDTDAVAWTSYHKARTNPAVISDFYPAQPEEPQVPWTCPDCGEKLEAQFCSCWNCGRARPKLDPSAPVSQSSAPAQVAADPWAARAQMPLQLPMRVVAFCLPLIILAGWFIAAGLKDSYKTKGFARKRQAFDRTFVAGIAFWVLLILLSWVWMQL